MSSIEYVAVLRGRTVIAAHGDAAVTSERELVKLLPSSGNIEQRISNAKLFTFVPSPALTFVCVSPQSVDKQRPLGFLTVLSRRWMGTYGPVSASATAHALDAIFDKDFSGLFNDYNQAKHGDIARELDETQKILTDSVSRAYDRGSELDNLASKSEGLVSTSEEFRKSATNLKRRMRCQHIRYWLIWIIVILAIIYLILVRWCDGWRLDSCL
jgi:hypothetical protein